MGSEKAIHAVELVHKTNIYGYSKTGQSPFIKILLQSPTHLNQAKRIHYMNHYDIFLGILESGFAIGPEYPSQPHATFESNIPIVMRFMVDTKVYH